MEQYLIDYDDILPLVFMASVGSMSLYMLLSVVNDCVILIGYRVMTIVLSTVSSGYCPSIGVCNILPNTCGVSYCIAFR